MILPYGANLGRMKFSERTNICLGGDRQSGYGPGSFAPTLKPLERNMIGDRRLVMVGALMKARIKWVEDRTFIGESGSGHKIVLGTAFGPEGRSPGPSPMELVLIGMGGCSGYDVVHILEKGHQAIEDVTVELEAERAQQDPKVFTRIRMHFVVKGRGLTAEKVERAIALSVEKYCSASAMIAKTATITHDFEVVDDTATGAGTP
jgi:putative redox protein